jgi:hypothetical protein
MLDLFLNKKNPDYYRNVDILRVIEMTGKDFPMNYHLLSGCASTARKSPCYV